VESICRFGSCCDLHQNRLPGRSLCYIDDIVFAIATKSCRVNNNSNNGDTLNDIEQRILNAPDIMSKVYNLTPLNAAFVLSILALESYF
jgi:hypothetical protein